MNYYTLQKVESILRTRLQDDEYDEYALRIFINDSLHEILGEDKYPFMQRIDNYTADENGEVNLPPFYGGTFYIYAKKDGQPRRELNYISPEEFFNNTKEHQMVYTVFANTLFYRIFKDTDNNGFEITHLYLANPGTVENSQDLVIFPPQYIEALILGALARAEQRRDNFDYAQIYRNEQDQILTNMKLRYGPGNLTAQNRAKLPYFGGYADDRN